MIDYGEKITFSIIFYFYLMFYIFDWLLNYIRNFMSGTMMTVVVRLFHPYFVSLLKKPAAGINILYTKWHQNDNNAQM